MTSIVPVTLTLLERCGFTGDRATEGMAASWKTTSHDAAATSSTGRIEDASLDQGDPLKDGLEARPVAVENRR